MPDVDTGPLTALDSWKLHVGTQHNALRPDRPKLLACGTKIWPGSPPCGDYAHYPEAEWRGTDVEGGAGVDYVGDIHSLDRTCPDKFHGIFCQSVFEHLERPWVAMIALGRLLLPGGVLFVGTHQTYPLHGYPKDYWRFSGDALRTMAFDADLEVLAATYDHPCTIVPAIRLSGWNDIAKAFLNVSICAKAKQL